MKHRLHVFPFQKSWVVFSVYPDSYYWNGQIQQYQIPHQSIAKLCRQATLIRAFVDEYGSPPVFIFEFEV